MERGKIQVNRQRCSLAHLLAPVRWGHHETTDPTSSCSCACGDTGVAPAIESVTPAVWISCSDLVSPFQMGTRDTDRNDPQCYVADLLTEGTSAMGVMLTSWGSLRSWTRDPPTVCSPFPGACWAQRCSLSVPPSCLSDFPSPLGGFCTSQALFPMLFHSRPRLQVWVRSVGSQGAGQLLFWPRLAAQALVPGSASSV